MKINKDSQVLSWWTLNKEKKPSTAQICMVGHQDEVPCIRLRFPMAGLDQVLSDWDWPFQQGVLHRLHWVIQASIKYSLI